MVGFIYNPIYFMRLKTQAREGICIFLDCQREGKKRKKDYELLIRLLLWFLIDSKVATIILFLRKRKLREVKRHVQGGKLSG